MLNGTSLAHIPSVPALVIPAVPHLPLVEVVVVPGQLILTLRQIVPEDHVVPYVEMVSVTHTTVRMPVTVPGIAAVGVELLVPVVDLAKLVVTAMANPTASMAVTVAFVKTV